jgi:2-iminobutanoate/2-iminopropanoate deaminase
MNPEIINPLEKPTPIISPAIKLGNLVYTSGQIGVDPETEKLAGAGLQEQTRQVMDNIKMLVEAAGSSMDKVIKCLVFLTDMKDYAAMNGVYTSYFAGNPPARSCVKIDALAKPEWIVEIEAIAAV